MCNGHCIGFLLSAFGFSFYSYFIFNQISIVFVSLYILQCVSISSFSGIKSHSD